MTKADDNKSLLPSAQALSVASFILLMFFVRGAWTRGAYRDLLLWNFPAYFFHFSLSAGKTLKHMTKALDTITKL